MITVVIWVFSLYSNYLRPCVNDGPDFEICFAWLKASLHGETAFFTWSLTSRKPPLVFLLRGRETKLSSCCSECRGSPLQLSYFLVEVIQFFDACQLGRPRGAGAVLRRDIETDVRRGGKKGRWTVVVREERAEVTRVTTVGRAGTKWMWKRGDKTENAQRGKGDKKEGESRGDTNGAQGGKRSSLLIRLTKQKTQEGNTNTLHS